MAASEITSRATGLDDLFDLRFNNTTSPDITSPDPGAPAVPFLEAEIHLIASLLQPINSHWSKVPRLYTVLRIIDQLPLLDSVFLPNGFTDIWLPFSLSTLPDTLPLTVRSAFMGAQPVVLTKGVDLEKGERGAHRHFGPDEPLPFESMGELGTGAFGAVDRVVSTLSGRQYARKLLPRGVVWKRSGGGQNAKERMRAFMAELDVLKKLRHRHVVEYIGSYTDVRYLGIIIAPVADGDLAWYLKRISAGDSNDDNHNKNNNNNGGSSNNDTAAYTCGGALERTSAAEKRALLRSFFGCLAAALDYLHSSQIRHKDIKPQNILVTANAGVLLTDFGLSLDWTDLSRSTTKARPAAWTPRYAAPEVLDFEPRGRSADLWSLGCVFLEMLTVLKGETLEDMMAFYESYGSGRTCFGQNEAATEEWMNVLKSKGATRADDSPLRWIGMMLKGERKDRASAGELFEEIAARDPRTHQASRFCGPCCGSEALDGDDFGDDFGEDDEWNEMMEEECARNQSATTFPAADIEVELQALRQAAALLARPKVSSRAWLAPVDKALARLENDTLPPAATGKLFHELVPLLTDVAWNMVGGEIRSSNSAPRNQEMIKAMLEFLERTAMLSVALEQKTNEDVEELAKCVKYMSAVLRDKRLNERLGEARERLLVETESPSSIAASDEDGGIAAAPAKDPYLKLTADITVKPTSQTPDPYPLHSAAERDDLTSLTNLLADGTDPNHQDEEEQTPLHYAARAGSEFCAIKLLSSGARASATDKNRWTPLCFAAKQGNRVIVRELIQTGSGRLNAKTSNTGYTPLHLAVMAGNVTVADLLLKAGADVDATDALKRTPLFSAPDAGTVELLRRHGANIFATGNEGETALHLAVREKRVGVVPSLLNAGLRVTLTDDLGRNALHVAVEVSHHELVQLLLQRDDSAIDVAVRGGNKTPLRTALDNKDKQIVQLLLEHDADFRSEHHRPFMTVLKYGWVDAVKYLHKRGQDLNLQSSDGCPLDIAASAKDYEMVEFLVEHGAQFTFQTSSSSSPTQSVLHNAIEIDDYRLVGLLLGSLDSEYERESGTKSKRTNSSVLTARGQLNYTPLCLSVYKSRCSITHMLLDRGADPDDLDDVPLSIAAVNNSFDEAKLLLDHGADVHKSDRDGLSPIHHASANASLALVELLVTQGANVNQFTGNNPARNATYYALIGGKPEVLEFLVGSAGAKVHDDLLAYNQSGRTRQQVDRDWVRYSGKKMSDPAFEWLKKRPANPKMLETREDTSPKDPFASMLDAIQNGDTKKIKLILKDKALTSPTSTDGVDTAPLRHRLISKALLPAIDYYDVECVHLLLDAGAEPNRNISGGEEPPHRLPLVHAVERAIHDPEDLGENTDVIHALLEAGADPAKKCRCGKNALTLVLVTLLLERKQVESSGVLRLLLDHCGKHAIQRAGLPALSRFAQQERENLVELLLDYGVDISTKFPSLWMREKLRWPRSSNKEIAKRVVRRVRDGNKVLQRLGIIAVVIESVYRRGQEFFSSPRSTYSSGGYCYNHGGVLIAKAKYRGWR